MKPFQDERMTPTEYAEALAAEVRAEMGRQRKTSTDLAAVLGVTKATARTRLSGSQPLDVLELAQIADWLGVSPESLLADLPPALVS